MLETDWREVGEGGVGRRDEEHLTSILMAETFGLAGLDTHDV